MNSTSAESEDPAANTSQKHETNNDEKKQRKKKKKKRLAKGAPRRTSESTAEATPAVNSQDLDAKYLAEVI